MDYLSGHELSFWKDLIEKYLKPIDADKQKEASHCIFCMLCCFILLLYCDIDADYSTFYVFRLGLLKNLQN